MWFKLFAFKPELCPGDQPGFGPEEPQVVDWVDRCRGGGELALGWRQISFIRFTVRQQKDTCWFWFEKNVENLTKWCVCFFRYWLTRPESGSEPDDWKHNDPLGEDCGHIDTGEETKASWMDASCKTLYQWICEKSIWPPTFPCCFLHLLNKNDP